jgi:peptidoglycan hydrolase CwlO-like protein
MVRLKAAALDIKQKQMDLNARSKAFAGTLDTMNTALSRLAVETAAMQKQRSEIDSRDALLTEKEAALAEDTGKLQQAREMFETRRKEFEELALRFEKESRRRMDDLKTDGKAVEGEHHPHVTKRKGSKR